MISERILDVGLSVRKRVISISNKICTQQPNHPIVTKILLALISRINDEEQSIRDMVLKTFKGSTRIMIVLFYTAIWFEKPSLTSTSLTKIREEEDKTTFSRTQQIFEVVSSLLEKNCQNWIVDLLKSIVKQDSQSETKSAEVVARIAKISDCIVEQLLRLEETSNAKKMDSPRKEPSRLVVYITALSLISQASPAALLSHVETLEPYLKSQVQFLFSEVTAKSTDQESSLVQQHVAAILGRTVPLIDFPSVDFINSLAKDLSTLLYKSGMPVKFTCFLR